MKTAVKMVVVLLALLDFMLPIIVGVIVFGKYGLAAAITVTLVLTVLMSIRDAVIRLNKTETTNNLVKALLNSSPPEPRDKQHDTIGFHTQR